jgi:uncharacterized protein GlcG (DUF336 family)
MQNGPREAGRSKSVDFRSAPELEGRKPMPRVSPRLWLLVLGSVLGASLATMAQAQGLVSVQKMSAALANEAVAEAVAACARKGYTVTSVVVDLDGVRQALLRGDGAPIHSLDNAFYRAYSAASLTLSHKEESTKAVADRISKDPLTSVPPTDLPNVTYAQGGVTILVGKTAIGGIGVSGAPGGNFDEECAQAGIAKIRDRLK